ncbi:MAG: PT domain-containing protein [Clostridia bacterium]|nr:PT domain-containing protein [Clostridia bacterium]
MKKYSVKRVLTAVLAALMLATCAVGLVLPASAAEVSVQNGTGTRGAVSVSTSYAYRAKVNGEFTAFSFAMPTWTQPDSACTLALYKWTGDPEDSLKAEPIATQRFDPMKDNATNKITFDPQPAGEYLFAVIEPRGSVGVWTNENCTDNLGFLYSDGQEKNSLPELKITFTEDLAEPFGKCETIIEPVDGNHTAPEEYVIPSDSLIYTHEVMPDTWVFTDGLGRVSLTNAEVGDPRADKTVSMFFWTWHNGRPTCINVNDAAEKYPEAVRDYNHPVWTPAGFQGSWNEPIYGHYESSDQWVLRRQAELLAAAGVDAILTDNTNGTVTHKPGYTALFESWGKAMDDGVLTPKVSFMLPFGGGENTDVQVRDMYMDFYRAGDHHRLWFYWEGKPVLMARQNAITTKDNVGKEITNFFTFRGGQSAYVVNRTNYGEWGWLSTYPQAIYYANRNDHKDKLAEQITVGVAMNHNYKLGQLSAMSGNFVMGRSYTHDYQDRYDKEGKEASKWGYNFAEQFKYALETDPKMIFITGWNEWAMARINGWPEGWESEVPNAFCDQFNDEFSRDLEPTKGALKDHYYYQMVNFVRRYKGVRPIPTPTLQATIDITKDNTQWSEVGPYYAAYIGNTGDREGEGWGNLQYHEYSGRNDIIGARVARDADNLYFYVECNEDITPYTDPLWMVLYIDSDQQNQGWETFDYVLNKTSPTADKATLEKFTGNGYETEAVGEVEYTVGGKYMQVKVPKTMLSIEGFDFTVNFAWTDNVHDEVDAGERGDADYKYTKFSGDIMDFYISGDVAPAGRFKFSYISTAENAGVESTDTEQPTEAPTDPVETPTEQPTDGETEAPTDAPATEAPTETPKKGCGSSVALGLVALVALMGTALLGKKER